MQVRRGLICALGLWAVVRSGTARADSSVLHRPPDLRRDEVRCGAQGCVLGECVTTRMNESPDWLWTGARVVPNFTGGQAQGLRMFAVRPGSLLSRLGIENGDTLLAINDVKLTGLESAQHAIKRAQAATDRRSQVFLEVLHAGQARRRELQLDAATSRTDCPTLADSVRQASHADEATLAAKAEHPISADRSVPDDPQTQAVLADAQQQIKCSEKGCSIPRRLLLQLLEQPLILTYGSRLVPVLRAEAVVGWSVRMTTPQALLTRLGLRSGDTIVRIAGHSLSSPAQAQAAFETLRTRSSFQVVLMRQGSQRVLRYLIE